MHTTKDNEAADNEQQAGTTAKCRQMTVDRRAPAGRCSVYEQSQHGRDRRRSGESRANSARKSASELKPPARKCRPDRAHAMACMRALRRGPTR